MPYRVLLTSFLLIGCAPLPDLGAAISPSARGADYPVVAPLDNLPQPQSDETSQDAATILAARAASLRARAAVLRRTPIN